MPCPTVHDFSLVDQDQSDNVTTQYLVTAGGQTAEPGSGVTGTLVNNGSDNLLLDMFVDPALGCTGSEFAVPTLSSPGTMEATQATDELLASADQKAPAALVPPNDPMTTVGADIDIIPNDFPTAGNLSTFKTDLYRAELGQPLIGFNTVATATPVLHQPEGGRDAGGQRRAVRDDHRIAGRDTAGSVHGGPVCRQPVPAELQPVQIGTAQEQEPRSRIHAGDRGSLPIRTL